jgi:hypothetical protein
MQLFSQEFWALGFQCNNFLKSFWALRSQCNNHLKNFWVLGIQSSNFPKNFLAVGFGKQFSEEFFSRIWKYWDFEANFPRPFSRISYFWNFRANLLQSFLKNFEHWDFEEFFEHLACSCSYIYSNKSDSPHYEMLKELQKVRFGTLA